MRNLDRLIQTQWKPFRFVLGPWRWLIIVYDYDEVADRVGIVTVQDARSSRAAATDR